MSNRAMKSQTAIESSVREASVSQGRSRRWRSKEAKRICGKRGIASLLTLACIVVLVLADGQRGFGQDLRVGLSLPGLDDRSALVFSPDSKLLVAAEGWWGVMLAWDLEKGKARAFANAQGERLRWNIRCVAFSPKGDTLAVGHPRGVGLFDVATGRVKGSIDTGIGEEPESMAFASNGKTLAVAFRGTAIVWDLTGREMRRIADLPRGLKGRTAIAPDGTILASKTKQGGVGLWRLDTGKQSEVLEADFLRALSWIVFSPDSKTLAIGEPARVHLWDMECKKRSATLKCSDGTVYREALAFSPDSRTLAVADYDGVIHVWEIASQSERASLRDRAILHARLKYIAPLAFSPDGRLLACGCEDVQKGHPIDSIKVWKLWNTQAIPPDAKDLVSRWDALRDANAAKAFPALRTMIAFPDQTLPWLRKHLLPLRVGAEESRKQDALVAELDSDDFATREKASKMLKDAGLRVEAALRRTLSKSPSLELRHRVLNLLEGIDRQKKLHALQQLRAVEVLEHIGTAESREILEELTKGVPESRLTQDAKASLARLKKRPWVKP